MSYSTYRWPMTFAVVALIAALLAFLMPSLAGTWIAGLIAAVFFALTLLALPTAVDQDVKDEPEHESMKTTLGSSD